MDYAIYFLISILGLFFIVKLFAWPIKILIKLTINGLLGYFLLFLVNTIGKAIEIYIPINATTCLVAGFFGVPGVIFLLIFNKIF